MMKDDAYIMDVNAPKRAVDGVVGPFYFWLGDEGTDYEDTTTELGDVDEPKFDFDEGVRDIDNESY